ncbi:MAG: hypothetical protein GX448_16010 [Planctomycetes bacterium]|nr:hypothetical protein [Planctomycetota bacterium]
MMMNTPEFQEFNRRLDVEERLSHEESLRIYDALHEEAQALGAISSENIWDGFEIDLRIASAMKGLKRAREADQADR